MREGVRGKRAPGGLLPQQGRRSRSSSQVPLSRLGAAAQCRGVCGAGLAASARGGAHWEGRGTVVGGAPGPGRAELQRHPAPHAGGAGAVLQLRLPPCALPRPAGFFFRFQINN